MKLLISLAILLCTTAAFGPAIAATGDDNSQELDNIIVTASRSPLAKVNVGSSTTVITYQQIQRRQARYVTDLLRSVPGFSVSHSGTTGSQTQVRVRGAEANHVLVLIDGVRANDPAGGDEFRWELLSTNNVERIEIVRGPQSSLWGSDAVAAVVNVISRSGGNGSTFAGYGEGGSNNTLNAGLNGGTGGDGWSLAYGIERLDTDGTNIARIGDENDDSNMTTGSLSGKYRVTDKLSLNLGIRTVDAYSQFDPTDFFVTGLPTDGDVSTDSTQTYVQGGVTLSTLDQRILHHVNFRYFDSDNQNLIDGVLDASTASDRRTIAYQADIQLDRNLLSLALEHERTGFQQRGQIVFGDPNQDQETKLNSAIVDFQGKSIARLTWLVGARYDDYSDFDNALTGRLSLAYELSESTRLRGNVGTGQKAPTFTERFGFFPGQFIGNPDLQPETSTSFDLGIEQMFMDDAIELQLTYFNQDLENEINGFVFDPVTFLFTADNIDGSSSRKGIEFAGRVNIAENVELSAMYTYTDSSEEDGQGAEIRELRRPKHAGSVGGNFRFLDERANLSVVADYGGSRTDIFFPPFPAMSEIVTLDSYWLVELTGAYDISKTVNLFARVANLLDEDYEQIYGYQTPGRSVFAGIRVSFGR